MEKQEGFAEVNGTRLYYEVAGTGYPLVLIHGFAVGMACWDDQIEALSQRHKVIRYDRRGFGRSADPIEQQSYSHFDDLQALLEYLGISQAHILGHSDGSYVAVDFALAYPNMTRSLISVSSGANGFVWPPELGEEISQVFSAAQENARKFGARAGNETLLQIPILKSALENQNAAPRIVQLFLNYRGWHWFNQDPAIALHPPAAERLGQITTPTCLIVGEKEHEGNLLEVDFMYQHTPNARKFVIPGAGHMVNIEAPWQFNEIVLQWINGVRLD